MDAALLALLFEYTGHADLNVLWATALLLAARLIPLLMLSPWVLPSRAGALASASVIALLWLVLLPVAARTSVPLVGVGLAIAVVREVLNGAAFAFVARLPLEAMDAAGRLAERAGGEPLPWSSPSHAPLSTLYRWLGVVLFVVAAGPEVALAAVADGLTTLPLGQALPWTDLGALTWSLVGWCAVAIAFGVVLAMPVALAVSLLNLAEALAQRWFRDWPSSAVWMPLRHVVALGFVSMSLALVASVVPDAFANTMH